MTEEQRLGLPDEPKKISDMACTDHGCIYGHPGGMGTNGGCHCLTEVRDVDDRRQISAAIRRGREAEKWGAAWREKALELEKERDELRAQLKLAVGAVNRFITAKIDKGEMK
jgi:hypothetical protein